MTSQKSFVYFVAWLVCLGLVGKASALTIMDWVSVGDPGNPENTVIKRDDFSSGYGAVAYTFRMGKYETTNLQYADFLNSVATTDTYDLYHASMGTSVYGGITRAGLSGSYSYSVKANMGNKPVNLVSWFDAARFANWLHNGQPTGAQDTSTTEDGAYTFSGPETVSDRNPGALFFLPTEHEWEKAAFYQPGAVTTLGNGWWQKTSGSDFYPTQATANEFGDVTNPGPYVANFRKGANWNGSTLGNVTTVGSSGNQSYYGAMDMSGNVFEWVMADPTKPDPNGWGPYTVRGGSFLNFGHVDIYERNLVHHDNHNIPNYNVGFRLAASFQDPVPVDFNADFNNDTFVNGLDLELWQAAYGLDGNADADGDGDSDGRDFLYWQQHYGMNTGLAAAALVPEPNMAVLAGFFASLIAVTRRTPYGKQ